MTRRETCFFIRSILLYYYLLYYFDITALLARACKLSISLYLWMGQIKLDKRPLGMRRQGEKGERRRRGRVCPYTVRSLMTELREFRSSPNLTTADLSCSISVSVHLALQRHTGRYRSTRLHCSCSAQIYKSPSILNNYTLWFCRSVWSVGDQRLMPLNAVRDEERVDMAWVGVECFLVIMTQQRFLRMTSWRGYSRRSTYQCNVYSVLQVTQAQKLQSHDQ